MATNFSPCKGSYVLNQFPSNVMFGMKGFHISASGAIQGHHGPLVFLGFFGGRGVVANIFGKGKHAGYKHFLFFAQCLQMASSTGSFNPFPNDKF